MMNDIMEKLIKNNREKLMSDLPAGHRERFEMKMMSQRDNETMRQRVDVTTIGRTRRLWLGIASAAAVSLILILINKQETIQPYIYEESEKMAEMRMLYETQLNETIVMLENVLMNVNDSTRNEINKVIDNLTSTTEMLADIAPLPEDKQLAIASQVYKNQMETLNIIYRKINQKERR